ncbi:MAG: acyltransferase family protein [Clostridia bacterium]|nr:acyltransferase family protein [Clostridia bacterium]
MYIFFLITLLVPMLALRRRTEADGPVLDSRSTQCIKGILCIYVMLHNLGLDLPNDQFKELICEHAGGVGVGLFFFLSAFGIIRSYQSKGNKYLPKLLFIHIPKLWLVAVFINALTYFSFMRGELEPLDACLRILNLDLFIGFNRINRHGWYIASIIALYIIFAVIYYLFSKLKTDKKFVIAGIVMALVPIAFRIAAKVAHQGGMYTRELPAFAIGCIYATFYDQINKLAKKYYLPALLVSLIAFVIGYVSIEAIATYASTVIVILISQKYTYYNKVTYFLGKICIGVYLFLHYSSIVLQSFIYNEYLWVLLNAGFIFEAAIFIYAAQYSIEWLIRRGSNIISKGKQKIA